MRQFGDRSIRPLPPLGDPRPQVPRSAFSAAGALRLPPSLSQAKRRSPLSTGRAGRGLIGALGFALFFVAMSRSACAHDGHIVESGEQKGGVKRDGVRLRLAAKQDEDVSTGEQAAATIARPSGLVARDHPNDDGKAIDLRWQLSADDDPAKKPRVVRAYKIFRSLADGRE